MAERLTPTQEELLKLLFYADREWTGPELARSVAGHDPRVAHRAAAGLVDCGLADRRRIVGQPVRYQINPAGRDHVRLSYLLGGT